MKLFQLGVLALLAAAGFGQEDCYETTKTQYVSCGGTTCSHSYSGECSSRYYQDSKEQTGCYGRGMSRTCYYDIVCCKYSSSSSSGSGSDSTGSSSTGGSTGDISSEEDDDWTSGSSGEEDDGPSTGRIVLNWFLLIFGIAAFATLFCCAHKKCHDPNDPNARWDCIRGWHDPKTTDDNGDRNNNAPAPSTRPPVDYETGKGLGVAMFIVILVGLIFNWLIPIVSFICIIMAIVISSIITFSCCCASDYNLQPLVKWFSTATLVSLVLIFIIQVIYLTAAVTSMRLAVLSLVFNIAALILSGLFTWGRGCAERVTEDLEQGQTDGGHRGPVVAQADSPAANIAQEAATTVTLRAPAPVPAKKAHEAAKVKEPSEQKTNADGVTRAFDTSVISLRNGHSTNTTAQDRAERRRVREERKGSTIELSSAFNTSVISLSV